ncbi:type II toxin-antitoxin system death-on-curing family toxin [Halorubrum salinum]|uniref:type II toxin-antitoxin system death-on-curing family toxin n=1 Tax=Halorubrum salinum TaxID=767517 RepID=UPI0021127A41|nr:type II toxin-antitoxin system death-on-curing family toxin [Halorubrum salinum]
MADSFWYPSVDDVCTIHDDIVSEYSDTHTGIQNSGDIEFALHYIEAGRFGTAPETVHEKVYHLLRLLVANHPFVDANKRTALNTAVVFYFLNGYRFEYDDEIRSILKQFGTDEAAVDEAAVIEYLRSHTKAIDLPGAIEEWREDLIRFGVDELTGDSSDPND